MKCLFCGKDKPVSKLTPILKETNNTVYISGPRRQICSECVDALVKSAVAEAIVFEEKEAEKKKLINNLTADTQDFKLSQDPRTII